jgi:hypothetical protein
VHAPVERGFVPRGQGAKVQASQSLAQRAARAFLAASFEGALAGGVRGGGSRAPTVKDPNSPSLLQRHGGASPAADLIEQPLSSALLPPLCCSRRRCHFPIFTVSPLLLPSVPIACRRRRREPTEDDREAAGRAENGRTQGACVAGCGALISMRRKSLDTKQGWRAWALREIQHAGNGAGMRA